MNSNFIKILRSKEPPSDLLHNILSNISERERISKLRTHIYIMTPFLLIVTISSAYFFSLLSATTADSEFMYYLSLVFSDTKTVMGNIGIYINLIAETAPVITITLFLTGILGILKVSEYLFKDVKSLSQLITHKHKTYANS